MTDMHTRRQAAGRGRWALGVGSWVLGVLLASLSAQDVNPSLLLKPTADGR